MLRECDKLVTEAYSELIVENEEALTDAIKLINEKLQEIKVDLEKILKKNSVENGILVADEIIDNLSIAMKPIIKDALSYAEEAEAEEDIDSEIEADAEEASVELDEVPAPAPDLPVDLPEEPVQ